MFDAYDNMTYGESSFFARQTFAWMSLAFLIFVVPIVVGIVLVFVTFSLWATGFDHHIHQHLWGWLTEWDHHTDKKGNGYTTATPNKVPIIYEVGVIWGYIIYQVCELIAWPIRAYRKLVRRSTVVSTGTQG